MVWKVNPPRIHSRSREQQHALCLVCSMSALSGDRPWVLAEQMSLTDWHHRSSKTGVSSEAKTLRGNFESDCVNHFLLPAAPHLCGFGKENVHVWACFLWGSVELIICPSGWQRDHRMMHNQVNPTLCCTPSRKTACWGLANIPVLFGLLRTILLICFVTIAISTVKRTWRCLRGMWKQHWVRKPGLEKAGLEKAGQEASWVCILPSQSEYKASRETGSWGLQSDWGTVQG